MELKETAYRFYSHGELKPQGWVRQQLMVQAQGLAGNLDKVWPDVRDSRWIGGDCEGWERVPYWLDGFIPLAYLLEDEDMIARAKRYIDSILARQEEDGFLCPCNKEDRARYDMWAMSLIAKVLTVYGDLSGDERIVPVLTRALKQFKRHIQGSVLFNWGAARWYECLIAIFWLYEKIHEEWLLELACILRVQGIDFLRVFEPYLDAQPKRAWTYLTHVVNLAMALKQEALWSRIGGGDPSEGAHIMLDTLLKYHGMAVGHFTGDECVAGDSPVQGSELCSVVEAMYSYEHLLAISGEGYWGDQLERLTFNALPATCSKDMWTHQYDQQTNQIRCQRLPEDHVVFGTNNQEAHLFGLEPNYGCCTANMGQGWPKFAMSTMMQAKNGVAVVSLTPAALHAEIGGVPVEVQVDSAYPFRDRAEIRIKAEKPVEFDLIVRIPGTAKAAAVNGEKVAAGVFHTLHQVWQDQTITVELEQEITAVARPRGMQCIWRGPLLFSLPVEGEWVMKEYVANHVERKFPYCDYEVLPLSDWAYGFAGPAGNVAFHEVTAVPFDTAHPPVTLEAAMAPLDWREEYGVAKVEPESRKAAGDAVKKTFIPYGCTTLRMTEMPIAE